jgi:hypothetical protein
MVTLEEAMRGSVRTVNVRRQAGARSKRKRTRSKFRPA